MSTALEAVDVEKVYPGPTHALAGVSIAIGEGQTAALIGESGSGKSTLLKMFNRLVRPTRGRVLIRGADASGLDPITLRRHTGYVQQEGGLLPHWPVARNVALVPGLLGWDRKRTDARTDELLDLVGLDPATFRARYPKALSGGQRQRVAVARALAADPDVVLLDEPFGALDAITRVEVQEAFRELATRLRKTMVLVTHDVTEAFRLGDRVGVMKEGVIVAYDTPEAIAATRDPYVRRLLDHASIARTDA